MGGYSIYKGGCKPAAKRGLLSYFLVGITGALIGGILVLTLAPAALLGRVVPYDTSVNDSTKDVSEDKKEEQAEAVYMPQMSGDVPVTAAAAQKAMPSVVGIRFKEAQEDESSEDNTYSSSTGVIVDRKGYILTCSSEADGNSPDISVDLSDGRSYPARVIWTDEKLDLSVLKINAENLVPVEMGDSNDVIIGETALAIGNSVGMRYERSVTAGIISSLNRAIFSDGQVLMEGLIETDASINDGNSGGPLINSSGCMVGINTIKVEGTEGRGYAVPVNLMLPIIKSIADTGTFRTPYLGITLGLDRESSSLYDYELDRGILIEKIDENSPAYGADLRKGDIILEINGARMDTSVSFRQAIFEAGVGNEINIKYLDSRKEERIVSVKLDELRGN